jgi:hypothetical protein
MTRDSWFKPRYNLCPTKKLSRHLFFCVWSWSAKEKSNLGRGVLNKNKA